jgi:hypothetical protein
LAAGLIGVGCTVQPSPTGAPRDAGDPPAATPPAGKPPAGGAAYGPGASLGGKRLFPDDNAWNQDVSQEPVDPNSDALIAGIGLDKPLHPDFGTVYDGAPVGIPYVVVPGSQPRVPVRFGFSADESDPGPYPVPLDAPVEGGAELGRRPARARPRPRQLDAL